MDQNNNVENQIDEIYNSIKNEVAEQVKSELTGKVTVIPTGYSPEKDIVGIVQQYNKNVDKIHKEMEHNERTYRDDVLKIKNYNLQLDLKDEQQEALTAIEYVYDKYQKSYQDKIDRMQKSAEYKEAKNEAFQLLNLLKDSEIPVQKILEIASPLIETRDHKSLEIVQILLAKNATANYAIDAAVNEIKQEAENPVLLDIMDCMKQYITKGEDGLRYYMYMSNFNAE